MPSEAGAMINGGYRRSTPCEKWFLTLFCYCEGSPLGQQNASFIPVGLGLITLPVHHMDVFTNLESLQTPIVETQVWPIINSVFIRSPFSGEWRGEAENSKLLVMAWAFCLSGTQAEPTQNHLLTIKDAAITQEIPRALGTQCQEWGPDQYTLSIVFLCSCWHIQGEGQKAVFPLS